MFYYKEGEYPNHPREGFTDSEMRVISLWSLRTVTLLFSLLVMYCCYSLWQFDQDIKKISTEQNNGYEFFATKDEENFIRYLEELDKSQLIDISITDFRDSHFVVTYRTAVVKAEGKLENIEIEKIEDFDEYIKFIGSQDVEIIDISIYNRDFFAILVYKKK